MLFLTIIGLLIVAYYFFYFVSFLFLDCDVRLAFAEKFGKPVSSLKGKTVWITGASGGIGKELAYVLAAAGCKLILTARTESSLELVKWNCLQRYKFLRDEDIQICQLDVGRLPEHKKAFDKVLRTFGKLDILVNNAGCSQRARWENIDIEVDKQMFDLNVFGALSLSRLAIKHFFETGGGQIVVNSSFAGIQPLPMSATYCGTKHALHGYFKPLCLEHFDKPISITIVCPGPVQTNILPNSCTEKLYEKYGVETPISPDKMSAERCATLMAIAIANKLDEVWMAKPKALRLLYLVYFFPNIIKWMLKIMGPKYMIKLRDSLPQRSENEL